MNRNQNKARKMDGLVAIWLGLVLVLLLLNIIFLAINGLLFGYVGIYTWLVWLWLVLTLVLLFIIVAQPANRTFSKRKFFAPLAWVGVLFGAFILANIWCQVVPTSGVSQETVKKSAPEDNEGADVKEGNEKVILAETTFLSGVGDWYEHIWFKPADTGDEVTLNAVGATFTAEKPNSRSGLMIDIDEDVSDYSQLILKVSVTAKLQTLTGTGWNGREAPVAVAVGYIDEDGLAHDLLGEDPSAPQQMFWRGFYYLAPNGQSVDTNGVRVEQNSIYDFTFDLMSLNPKPAKVIFVGVEGSGWQPRIGSINNISLTAVK